MPNVSLQRTRLRRAAELCVGRGGFRLGRRKVEFLGKSVTIACTDRDRSERFYEGVLGAERIPGDGYGCPRFRLGTLTLSLMFNATERSPAEFPTHAMPILWLEVADLAAAADWFARHEVEVVDPGDGQFMMVADPDGLVIEVWQLQPESEEVGG